MAACDELFRQGDETIARLDRHILSRQSIQYSTPAARCDFPPAQSHSTVPPAPAAHLKRCVDCQRQLSRPNFSNANWRKNDGTIRSSCTACASSTVAHPRLQAILQNKHAEVLQAALDEVNLDPSDSLLFQKLWHEAIETNGHSKLDAVMSGLVANLMASTRLKHKKELFGQVWRIAHEQLRALISPPQPAPLVKLKKHNRCREARPVSRWPEGPVGGYLVTAGRDTKGAREEIITALATQGVVATALSGGPYKSLVFVSARGDQLDLNAALEQLYTGGWACQYCNTVTPLEWVAKAADPPSVDECRPFMELLLGDLLPATTFHIDYKCHHKGTKAKRTQWIQHFANLVPDHHTVDLKAAAVVIDVRLFAAGAHERIGFSMRKKAAVRRCVRDTMDYHSLGSHGAPYYRAGLNLNAACPVEDCCVSTGQALEIEEAVSRYESILEAAIASSGCSPCSQTHCQVPQAEYVCKEAIEESTGVEHEVQCTNLVGPWKGVTKVQFQEYDAALRQKFGPAIMHTERIPNRILVTAASTIVPELLADDSIDPAPQVPFASRCHAAYKVGAGVHFINQLQHSAAAPQSTQLQDASGSFSRAGAASPLNTNQCCSQSMDSRVRGWQRLSLGRDPAGMCRGWG